MGLSCKMAADSLLGAAELPIHHYSQPQNHVITRYFRIARVVLHTLLGLMIAATIFPWARKSIKAKLIQWWCGRLLNTFNISVIATGHIPNDSIPLSSTMFVANHISWADIHALNSQIPLRFIAKSEIKHWPIFGYLVSKANTLFIDRNRKQDAKRTITLAHQSLQSGDNLCFFPEGTTTDGTEIKPFKSSLIQAAIQANATVRPVAIRYPNQDGSINTAAAYAGETSLLESMQQILIQRQPVVELHFLSPITPDDYATMDRRALTLQIEGMIRKQLML